MKRKTKKQPKYTYVTSQMEAKYRTIMNLKKKDGSPDWEGYQEFKDKLRENGGTCELGFKCICDEFLNRDKAAPCKMKVYTKVERDEDLKAKYADDTPKFEDDEAVAKKKKKKEAEKEAMESEEDDE